MNFGKKLRELRERKGLTQEELGNILNLTKANISKYENGKLEPNLETLKKVSDLFQVSAEFLLDASMVYAKKSKKEKIGNDIIQLLIKKGIIANGEELTDKKKEWLFDLLDKAIDMSKL
ncbi:helix-turn-helix transcriptional regulator [Wukongibacter baidiensis]|uniref:helix-turn-helix domain-containing protein n=1 Tax=Wukongibacter baidiensis TaxID=1723361 RepID=UPI003D7FB095